MSTVGLETKISDVVGGKTAKAIEKAFDIYSVRGLLEHYPRRYANKGELTVLSGLPLGEHISVVAQVVDVRERKMQRRRGSILEVRITDGTGYLSLTWFNQPWRGQQLRPGMRGVFSGKVGNYRNMYQLAHPEYKLFDALDDSVPGADFFAESEGKLWAQKPIPLYPATATVQSWHIQSAINVVLDALGPVADPMPEEVRAAFEIGPGRAMLDLRDSLEKIHRPANDAEWKDARASLKAREAFDLQLALLDAKRGAALDPATPRPLRDDGLVVALDESLPFALTNDQVHVGETLASELARPHPMHRLLQGEVGSGKTLVALRAMLQVVDSGGQAALLAPTEVLAAQHFRSIVEFLGTELVGRVVPVLLTGQQRAAERKRSQLSIASGTAGIVIGTHALMSESTTFYDLGLVVIDEQHRFGVEQREALRRKGNQPPHVLVMTATPIPRTVALTVFGDLEVSTITELPPGRPEIVTHAVPLTEHPSWENRAWERAAEEVAAGRQVYVVCPAISPKEQEDSFDDVTADERLEGADHDDASKPQLANVEETLAELRAHPALAQLRIAGLTGAMSSDDKEATMTAFAAGDIDVLVATTVIEVGVNVPNASLMIVRDAERFGISQLHQLRGRVGRGEVPGMCLLLTNAEEGTPARDRIEAIAATRDGFLLAEVDLEQRREGDILGSAQSGGRSTLKLLRVVYDAELILHARSVADELLSRDPELESAPGLAEQLLFERAQRRMENLSKS